MLAKKRLAHKVCAYLCKTARALWAGTKGVGTPFFTMKEQIFHERLASRMAYLGLLASDVAKRHSGLKERTVYSWTENKTPTFRNLMLLGEALRCRVAFLIGEDDHPDMPNSFKEAPIPYKAVVNDAEALLKLASEPTLKLLLSDLLRSDDSEAARRFQALAMEESLRRRASASGTTLGSGGN